MAWSDIFNFKGILENIGIFLSNTVSAIFNFVGKIIAQTAIPQIKDNQNWLDNYNKIFGVSLLFFAFLLIILFSKLSRSGQDVTVFSLIRSAFGRIPIVLILLFVTPILIDITLQELDTRVSLLITKDMTDGLKDVIAQFKDENIIKNILSVATYAGAIYFLYGTLTSILFVFLLELLFGRAIWLIASIFFPLYLVAYIYPPWGQKLNAYLNFLVSILISPIIQIIIFSFILKSGLVVNIIPHVDWDKLKGEKLEDNIITVIVNCATVIVNFLILDIIPFLVMFLLRAGGVMSHGVSSAHRNAGGAMRHVGQKTKQHLNDRIKYLDAPSQRTNRFKNSFDAIRGKGNTPDFKSSILRSPMFHGKNAHKVKDPNFVAPKTTIAAAAAVKGIQKTQSAVKNIASKARDNIQNRIEEQQQRGRYKDNNNKYDRSYSGGYQAYLLNKNKNDTQKRVDNNNDNIYFGGHQAHIFNKNNNKDKK